jgi:thiol-disulfide isomerase/thioredoxin
MLLAIAMAPSVAVFAADETDSEPADALVTANAGIGELPELKWHSALEPAIEEARQRKTAILVRVGAPWCGWCRRLDKEIDRPAVQQELVGWTLVLLDADENQEEVSRLSVGPIPALRILNTSGRTVRSHDGFLPADKLIRWLRNDDREPLAEAAIEIEVPELQPATLGQLVKLLSHRDPTTRETASKRLVSNRQLAGVEVAKSFAQGKLAQRLSSLQILQQWQAPIQGLDPWQPQTITEDRLKSLQDWAASIIAESPAEQQN